MKKTILFFLLIVLLICQLSSCYARVDTSDSFDSSIEIVEEELQTIDIEEKSSGILTSANFGASDVTLGITGAYQANPLTSTTIGSIIMFSDFENNVTVPLCDRVECSHNDEMCEAYNIDPLVKIFTDLSREKVFLVYDTYVGEESFSTITVIDSDGKNSKTIFKSSPELMLLPPLFVAQVEDNIYFNSISITGEEARPVMDSLTSVNINSGEHKVYEFPDNENNKIVGTYNEFILLCTETFTDDQSNSTIGLKAFNTADGSSKIIFEYDFIQDRRNMILSSYDGSVDDGLTNYCDTLIKDNAAYIIYDDFGITIKKFNLDTGSHSVIAYIPELTAKFPFLVDNLIDNKIIISNSVENRYAINIEDGTYAELYLSVEDDDPRDAFLYVVGEYEDLLYVSAKAFSVPLTVNSRSGLINISFTGVKYAFISKEDYFNNNPNYHYFTEFE